MNAETAATTSPRLTSLSHGGGCGCKIAPGVLADLLRGLGVGTRHPDLLVGTETADDAAVYRLNDDQAIVATTDFFMPIVDDPYDFGRIAATNALSDIYAMGGTPIFALALVGMPINVLPLAVIRDILRGGEAVCRDAGIPIAGGHSIDSVEPIYGLAAIGTVHPQQLKRNAGAQAGDVLILGKPLGVGVLSAAAKKEKLDAAGYRALIEATTLLNRAGAPLARIAGVHAMTDVTGFGLAGHLLEMCRAATLGASLRLADTPLLEGALELARAGFVTGASARNWAAYGDEVRLGTSIDATGKALLCDPQTSGGLLVACADAVADEVIEIFRQHGCVRAAAIGRFVAGDAILSVE
jgi:selenide, water dikinase